LRTLRAQHNAILALPQQSYQATTLVSAWSAVTAKVAGTFVVRMNSEWVPAEFTANVY
jgi:hypothetical protein